MYIKNELLCLHGSSDFLIHISVRTVTDDCMLMERSGNPVKLIEGEYSNIKVTTYDDISLVRGYLTAEK